MADRLLVIGILKNLSSKLVCCVLLFSFVSRYSFQDHLHCHIEGSDYVCVCDQCGLRCDTSTALRQHIKSVHVPQHRHVCSICGSTYTKKHHLVRHARSRHGLAPPCTTCSTCGQEFSKVRELKAHENVCHGGPKKSEPAQQQTDALVELIDSEYTVASEEDLLHVVQGIIVIISLSVQMYAVH